MSADTLEHIQAELQRLDLLLYRQILRLRATYQLSLDEFRGLYISDEHVDNLVNHITGKEGASPTILDLTERAEAIRTFNAEKWGNDLPWKRMVKEFNLSLFEQDVLLLALAPEIDLKYETLYAYLNNDVTRKWPTCDMALRLYPTDVSQKISLRKYLLPEATLFNDGLLQPIQPPSERPSWLASGFSLTAAVSHYVLGFPFRDLRLIPFVQHRIPTAGWDELPLSANLRATLRQVPHLFGHTLAGRRSPMLILEGRYGTGRSLAAEAICKELSVALFRVDLEAICLSPEGLQKTLQGLLLQQRLQPIGTYLERGEALFDKEGNPSTDGHRFAGQ